MNPNLATYLFKPVRLDNWVHLRRGCYGYYNLVNSRAFGDNG